MEDVITGEFHSVGTHRAMCESIGCISAFLQTCFFHSHILRVRGALTNKIVKGNPFLQTPNFGQRTAFDQQQQHSYTVLIFTALAGNAKVFWVCAPFSFSYGMQNQNQSLRESSLKSNCRINFLYIISKIL
jgi:hypothetical protein